MASKKERLLNCTQPRYKSQPRSEGAFVVVGVRESKKALIKDQNFFRDKTWNNSYRFSSKLFGQYHQKNIQRNRRLEARKQWENSEMLKEINRVSEERLDLTKTQLRECYDHSVNMRSLLQAKSGQKVLKTNLASPINIGEPNALTAKYPPAFFAATTQNKTTRFPMDGSKSKTILKQPQNVWNQFSELSRNHVANLFPDAVLRLKESTVEMIKSRIDKERENMQLIIKSKKTMHDYIKTNKTLDQSNGFSHLTLQIPIASTPIELNKIDFNNHEFIGLFVDKINLTALKGNIQSSDWIKSQSKTEQSNNPEHRVSCQALRPILKPASNVSNFRFNTECGDQRKDVQQLDAFDQNMKLHKRIMFNTRYPRIQLNNLRKLNF